MSMLAWAEMAMVPMLVMHLWHAKRAQEMSTQMAAHHHAMPAGHNRPCCPIIDQSGNSALLEFASTSLPCQDEHRCCFRQGPLSVPAPVRPETRFSPALAFAERVALYLPDASSNDFAATVVAHAPPPDLLGMIFRV